MRFADPCLWRASGTERRCNPTCYKTGDGSSPAASEVAPAQAERNGLQ